MADTLTLSDLADRLAREPELLEQFAASAREAGIARDLLDLLTPEAEEPPPEKVIPLRGPITDGGGGSYAELKLREPVVDDMLKLAGKVGTERIVELIFVQTAIPVSAIRKMKVRDLDRAAAYFGLFF